MEKTNALLNSVIKTHFHQKVNEKNLTDFKAGMDIQAFVSNIHRISNYFTEDMFIFLKSIACENKSKYLPIKTSSILLTT